jgi:hypothetical protein
MKRAVAVLLPLFLAALPDAAHAAETIEASDPSVLLPSLQAEINFKPGERFDHALEIGYLIANGSATQTLDNGSVSFGGSQFNAPVGLQYDFDMKHLQVNYRLRRALGGGFGYEAIIGGAINQLQFTIRSPSNTATDTKTAPFLTYGLGALYNLRSGSHLHLRAAGYYVGLPGQDSVNINRLSLFFEQMLSEHWLVRAGYESWWLRSTHADSPLRLDFRGLALGLEVRF